MYQLFKSNNLQETYLSVDLSSSVRQTLIKFRFGVSDIAVHALRYNADKCRTQLCLLCGKSVDNEVHFVFKCPMFQDLRAKFIPPKYYNRPSEFRLVLLMCCKNKNVIKNLAIFLYKAFKRQSEIL